MSHLHYHDREELQKLYDKAVKEGKETIIYQGDELLVSYLKFVLELFSTKDINEQ